MHFKFQKLLDRLLLYLFPCAVSDDVTTTSSLRSDVMKFSIFLVKWVLRMAHARNYEPTSTLIEVMQKKTVASFFPDTVY